MWPWRQEKVEAKNKGPQSKSYRYNQSYNIPFLLHFFTSIFNPEVPHFWFVFDAHVTYDLKYTQKKKNIAIKAS